MTTVVRRGTTVLGTSGTTWANTANAVDGSPKSATTTYATWTSAVSGAVAYITIGGFNFPALPPGESLVSVTVTLRHYPSNATRVTPITFQPYDGATPIGSPATATLGTSVHNDSATFPVTVAQLTSPNFNVRATATRTANTFSTTWNVDSVDVSAVDTAQLPKIATVVDPFDTQTTGWTPWNAFTTVSSGQLRLLPASGSTVYTGTERNDRLVLKDSAVLVEVVSPGNMALSSWEAYPILLQNTTGASTSTVQIYISGNGIQLMLTTVGTFGSTPYNATNHRWLRLRETSGTFYFEASADGTVWNVLHSRATSTLPATFDVNEVWLKISAGSYVGQSTLTAMVIDNLNNPPAPVVADGRPKVWTGSAWAKKPVKVWTGSAWVEKPMKVWTGSQWKLL